MLVDALRSALDNVDVQRYALSTLVNLTAVPTVAIAVLDGVQLLVDDCDDAADTFSAAVDALIATVVATMQAHGRNGEVLQSGCNLLGQLAAASPVASAAVLTSAGLLAILSAMQTAPASRAVQQAGCRAISQLCPLDVEWALTTGVTPTVVLSSAVAAASPKPVAAVAAAPTARLWPAGAVAAVISAAKYHDDSPAITRFALEVLQHMARVEGLLVGLVTAGALALVLTMVRTLPRLPLPTLRAALAVAARLSTVPASIAAIAAPTVLGATVDVLRDAVEAKADAAVAGDAEAVIVSALQVRRRAVLQAVVAAA